MQQLNNAVWRACAALMYVVLAGCGGGGGGGGSTPLPSPAPAGSKLFVSDGGNHAIGSMINPNPGAGNLAIDRIITGAATLLGSGGTPSPDAIPSMALDAAADQLYASTQLQVVVFSQASLASGNVAPARKFTSTITKNATPSGVNFFKIFLDTANNRLYVAEPDGFVHAFDSASGLNGAVLPGRSFQINVANIIVPFDLAVDTVADNLFVGIEGNGFTQIYIYNTQSAKGGGGLITPDQTLSFSPVPTSFYLDSVNNRLYVATFGGDIKVFNNANALTTGTPTPARTIPLSLVSTIDKHIFVDTTNDRLYAVGTNQVFIISNASTVNGPGFPVTQITLPDANARFSSVLTKP